ncbi:DNA primase [Candidatus Poribacteria bacterium]|nr:DNA primase [Candidatus Poribacteria bacterium]MYB64161.1 DNA primase [Candidatus Poribacteria bacterium]
MAAKNYISRKITEDVRSRNNIVDVISECGVALKQAGANYKALCPFHEEKTPSFSVSSEKQMFYCFGCQAGGDVIDFLQKHEGKNFIESIEWLAKRANITLPARDTTYSARQKRINDLSELNTFAVKYYHELLRTGQHSQQAREYLKNRGIVTKTTNLFQLGYAKAHRNDLVKAATHEGWTVEQLVDVGLIKNEDKGPQDRFWNRLLFPIHNERGVPVGFGGRALSDEHQPKYLNSPGTDLYNKSRILYNLDKARQSIARKKSAILVEGYMDVLMLYQHGIENVIAASGTSLSEEHAALLKRYTPEVVIVFDGDVSGLQAAQRGLNRLIAEEIRVRIALMPKGDDPDSFVKENGADAFTERIDGSINLIEFQIQAAAQEKNIRRPDVITRVVRDVSELLVNIKHRVERAEYVKYAARELNMDEGLIWRELRDLGLKETPTASRRTPKKKMTIREQIELQFIQSLLQAPGYIPAVKSVFDHNDISQPHLAKIAEMLWRASENGDTVEIQHILDNCEDKKLKSAITRLLMSGQAISNHYAIIQGCIKKLINYICQDVEQRERSEGDDDLEKLKKLVTLSNERRAYVQKKVEQLKQNTEHTDAATDTTRNAKDIKKEN